MAARTETVLKRLDKDRTVAMVRFLAEAGLISQPNPVINLRGADLSGSNLKGVDLSNTDLGDTNLSDTDLTGAKLADADLRGANLTGAKLTVEQLYQMKSGAGATMPDGSKYG